MIVTVKDKKILGIKIGNLFPGKGDICVPDSWGSKDINKFLNGNMKFNETKNTINERDPNKGFYLKKVI